MRAGRLLAKRGLSHGVEYRNFSRGVHDQLLAKDLTSRTLFAHWIPSMATVPSFALLSLYVADAVLNMPGSTRHVAPPTPEFTPASIFDPRFPLSSGVPPIASLIPTTLGFPFDHPESWLRSLSKMYWKSPIEPDRFPQMFTAPLSSGPPGPDHYVANSVPCEPAFVTSRLLFGRGAPGRLLTTKLAVAMLLCGNWTPPPASDADRPPPAPMQQRRGGKGQGEKGRGGPARGGQSRGGQPRGGQAGGRRPPKPPGK